MTSLQFEHYSELIKWQDNLKKIIQEIDSNSKTQFGPQVLIGKKPIEFKMELIQIITDKIDSIEELKEQI